MRCMPMKAGTFTISSGFEARWGTFHYGLDFAAPDGTPIYAAQAGTVVYIGAATGFGQWIVIDHPTEAGSGTTVYGHMWDAFATGLRQGDWVEAGQLIAYVGANGQSTGAHLHFEVHPTLWRAGSQIDPAPWLSGAVEPGVVAPAPVVGEGRMTFFGIDIASYQAGLDMSRVKAEGFSYVIAKATEGSGYTNPFYREQRDGARANGLLFGAYHYVKAGDSARSQVDRFESVEPDRGVPVMLDHELTSGDAGVLWAVRNEFVARGYRVNLIYLPNWYWSGHIGSPDLSGLPPLMASNYVNGSGFASDLYPGDDNYRWNGYGNNTVAILQFSESGRVAGYTLDVNAFKGTVEDLAALFGVTPLEVVVALADDELGKKFPSRSIYRDNDAVIDTLAGYVLNVDARIHEDFVERQALRGVPDYVAKVKRVAEAGMAGVGDQDSKNRAQAVLAQIEGK